MAESRAEWITLLLIPLALRFFFSCTCSRIESQGACTCLGNLTLCPKVNIILCTSIVHFQHPLFGFVLAHQVCLYGFSSVTPGCKTVPVLQDIKGFLAEPNGLGTSALPENLSSAVWILKSPSWSIMEETICTYRVDWIRAEGAAMPSCDVLLTDP